ncbi:cupin domain-containing protein [Mucilaginibacter gossypii]|uniref:Cupin domain-containing protein n=1 Tax=Mucilaginibacter gossypii TaxID=551996 RepID=A0A1G8A7B4_9SPHI|nr:cupin domain-containing protein [Mucilaginibacter gossypii]SDH16773.1 Cupin domain-containing protein [Mucilaginibacter gossypii]
MRMQLIDPLSLSAANSSPYLNTAISELNDHVVRMGVMTAPYPWHYHPNSDETFIGSEGVVIIETQNQIFELSPGMVLTIPKGVPHCTRPKGERSVNLTIERSDMETVFT